MKARLVLASILLALVGMSSTLYYVLKKSPQYRAEAGDQMAVAWTQAKKLRWGPYQFENQQVFVTLPDSPTDWSFDPRGDDLWVQPKWVKVEPATVQAAQVWTVLSTDFQKALSETLNFYQSKGSITLSPPQP